MEKDSIRFGFILLILMDGEGFVRFGFILLILMDGEGFEPSKASPTDLQSAPFGHSGIHP